MPHRASILYYGGRFYNGSLSVDDGAEWWAKDLVPFVNMMDLTQIDCCLRGTILNRHWVQLWMSPVGAGENTQKQNIKAPQITICLTKHTEWVIEKQNDRLKGFNDDRISS